MDVVKLEGSEDADYAFPFSELHDSQSVCTRYISQFQALTTYSIAFAC